MTTLHLHCRAADHFEAAFRTQIEAFESAHPEIKVQLHLSEIDEHYTKLKSLPEECDLYLSVTDWIPEAISLGAFQPLDSQLATDAPKDWPTGWSESMRSLQVGPNGKTYALPWHDGPEVLHCREDFFDDPDEQVKFLHKYGRELGPPKDWDEFMEVARFYTRPETRLWGCCLGSYPDGHNNVYDFLIHLWSRGGQLLDESGQPAFNSKAGEEALTFLHDLYHNYKVASLDCLKMNSNQSGEFYAKGRVAMMWNWAGFAAFAEAPDSRIPGLNRCYPIPGGVSLNIYWVLAMTSNSKSPEATWAFMKHCATPEMDLAATQAGINGVRLSTWRDPEIQEQFKQYEVIEEVHKNVMSPSQIAEYPAINEVLSRMVDDVLNRRTKVKEALESAESECKTITESRSQTTIQVQEDPS